MSMYVHFTVQTPIAEPAPRVATSPVSSSTMRSKAFTIFSTANRFVLLIGLQAPISMRSPRPALPSGSCACRAESQVTGP